MTHFRHALMAAVYLLVQTENGTVSVLKFETARECKIAACKLRSYRACSSQCDAEGNPLPNNWPNNQCDGIIRGSDARTVECLE